MYIDAIQRKGKVFVWIRSEEGLDFLEVDAPYYCYVRDERGDGMSIFKDPVRKVEFDSYYDCKDFIESNKGNTFESDIPPLYKFLSDTFYGVEDYPLNVGIFDIEVEVDLGRGEGFPSVENPYGEVNSVSLYDRTRDTYHLIMLTDDKSIVFNRDDITVKHYHCVSERHVLDTFFKVIEDIDVLSAWNGEIFDIPYIIERCKRIYGISDGLKKLCRNEFKANEKMDYDAYDNLVTKYELFGRLHLDYMDLYKKFTFGERDSYKLDSIAEYEIKENKVAYLGDLGELYRNNPRKYFEYSLHDTVLLKRIDDKLKFLDLTRAMCRMATIRYKDVFGSIKYLEYSIRNYCHYDREQKLVLPDKGDAAKESFEGAFVLETNPGVYGWTSSIDLASLYPSVMRAINISPESHVLQCRDNHEDFLKVVERSKDMITVRHVRTGEVDTLPAYELAEFIKESKFTISAYGAIYDEEQGILPEILANWYKERKETKKLSKQYYKAGDYKLGNYYDMMQNLKKISLNSLYGAVSNPHCRFYSIELAASVTYTGQEIEKFQIKQADEIVKKAA